MFCHFCGDRLSRETVRCSDICVVVYCGDDCLLQDWLSHRWTCPDAAQSIAMCRLSQDSQSTIPYDATIPPDACHSECHLSEVTRRFGATDASLQLTIRTLRFGEFDATLKENKHWWEAVWLLLKHCQARIALLDAGQACDTPSTIYSELHHLRTGLYKAQPLPTHPEGKEHAVRLSEILIKEALWHCAPLVCMSDQNDASPAQRAVGRCLLATEEIARGQVVVCEKPVLVWSTDDEEHRLCPFFPTDLVRQFLRLNVAKQSVVWDMCCPSIGLQESTALYDCASRFLCRHRSWASSLQAADVCRLAMIAKINAHRFDPPTAEAKAAETKAVGTAVTLVAIFPVMSKVAHSCAPNCMYNSTTGCYVAMRPIAAGEAITFSYFGSQKLLYGNDVRQLCLRQSHAFSCSCVRCASPVDLSRGVRCTTDCPDGVRLRNMPQGTTREFLWRCTRCQRVWTDAQMPLDKEEALATTVHELSLTMDRPSPNWFERTKVTLVDVLHTFGRRHWLYPRLCEAVVHYFVALTRGHGLQGKALARETADIALTVASKFGHKFVAACLSQGLGRYAPVLIAEFAIWLAKSCDTVNKLRPSCLALLSAANRLVPIAELAAGTADAEYVTTELGKASQTLLNAVSQHPHLHDEDRGNKILRAAHHTTISTDTGDDFWVIRAVSVEDDDVLEEWSNHLSERLSRAMKASSTANRMAEIQDRLLKRMETA